MPIGSECIRVKKHGLDRISAYSVPPFIQIGIEVNIENDIEKLTRDLMKICRGKNIGVVMGASLNMIMTSAQSMPDPAVRAGLIRSFKQIVHSLEQRAKGHLQ